MKFKNDMGRSMFEMILYLGLIVVLTTSTIKMYSDSVEKTRLIKLDNQIDDLKEYVNTYFLGRSLPTDWTAFKNAIGGDSKFDDPWGGKLTIVKGKEVANTVFNKDNFEIKYSGAHLNSEKCINIGNAFIQKGAFALIVNSKQLSEETLTISNIASNCKTSDSNTIEGFFYKE